MSWRGWTVPLAGWLLSVTLVAVVWMAVAWHGRTGAADMVTPVMFGAILTVLILGATALSCAHRRRIAQAERMLAVTLDNISQGIAMIGRDGRLRVVNRRTAEILGLPSPLVRPGTLVWDIIAWQLAQGEFTGAEAERVRRVLAQRRLDLSATTRERTRPDGRVIEIRTRLLPDGAAVRTFTDITDRARFEQTIAAARDAAEAGSRARTAFLGVMSHEMRTPLNAILGAVGLMQGLALPAEATAYAAIVQEAGSHLLTLVDDVLDVASLDAGRLELRPAPCDLPALIEGVAGIRRATAEARGLTLTLHCDPTLPATILIDAGRLRQVLMNLVDNAIKFTREGGVAIAARAGDGPHGRWLWLTVRDSGIGIAPDLRTRLFDPFTQADGSLTRQCAGIGLGLTICQRLVALMGGEISVESEPGQGSTFTVRLPLRSPEPPASAVAGSPPLRVLIAEDNPTNRLVATRMLTRMGHAVEAVEDGAAAVAALRRGGHDVVLMDMMMPVMDGLAATRAIRREQPPLGRTPVVGLTANARPEDQAACLAAGMDAFLAKPVTAERLGATLRHVVAAPGSGA